MPTDRVDDCLKMIGYFPSILALVLILSSYLMYWIHIQNQEIAATSQAFYLILIHPFLFMFLFSFWRVATTSAGNPVQNWKSEFAPQPMDSNGELGMQLIHTDTVELKTDGSSRFCKKCDVDKPDRCHHCSICGRCILKFDHHCPWLK
jgi:hypothetical protein